MVSLRKQKASNFKGPLLTLFFVLAVVACVATLNLTSQRITTTSTITKEVAAAAAPKQQQQPLTFDQFAVSSSGYDPKKCKNFQNGSCEDEDGGAWSYKGNNGGCVHTEKTIPRDLPASRILPTLFPGAESVLDFGGGVGSYLLEFRDAGYKTCITVEPQPLGDCLFQGLQQDLTDWINTPLDRLPKDKYDVVMTIEVAEHIPVEFHEHLIKALAQATKKYLVFSAARPGQPGQGHVGPSMKRVEKWIEQAQEWTSLTVDDDLTKRFRDASRSVLKGNSVIFQKQ